MAQTANGVQTRFTQDLVSPLSQILQTTQGTTTKSYVYGHERLYEQSGIVKTWYGGDGLGSVRQTLDTTGAPLSALNYDPWGTPEGGATPPTFGFTGEWQDAGVGLVNLRARWYQPGQGRFTARDPFEGFDMEPVSLHPYLYTGGNPINRVDPSGNYWWGAGQKLFDAAEQRSVSSNIHVRIQAIMMVGRQEEIHAEYSIPGTALPVDLLDSITGEMWEIKPWDDRPGAHTALDRRLTGMATAQRQQRLKGIDPRGRPYNWNFAPLAWESGINFPTTPLFIGTDETGQVDFYAAQVEPGIILWWKYQRKLRVPDNASFLL